MTEVEAIELMSQTFLNGWNVVGVPVTFEGEALEATEGFVRVTFLHTVRRQTTMGVKKFESRGNIFVQLFGPTGVGVQQLAGRADLVRSFLEAKRLDEDLTTYAGSTREVPSDGRWLQRTVVIPFVYESIG